MTPKDLEKILKEIALLMELNGENHFKTRAFDNAARISRSTNLKTDEFIEVALAGKVKGIGKGIQEVLQDVSDNGSSALILELREKTPAALLELTKISGLGAKKARKLFDELNISNLDELIQAGREGRIAEIKGFGGKASEKIVEGAERLKSYQGKVILNEAEDIFAQISNEFKRSGLIDEFVLTETFDEVVDKINIAYCSKKGKDAELLSKKLIDKSKQVTVSITPTPPAQIEKIKQEKESSLKNLVNLNDIKGVIHAHSHYSDGSNSLKDLASAIKDMGYEYLGITDHSQTAAYAGGLRVDDIKRQHEEIDKLNEELAPFKIFKGIESDILTDGSLDYEDNILASFDFIISSVHNNFTLSRKEMTKRVVRAVENPYTTILGHPTGRLLLRREEYQIDLDEVIEVASETNTVIEINANPRRLDLSWRYHQSAKKKGVKLSVCPDAHSIEGVDCIKYGVAMAQKGLLTKEDIITCMNKDEISSYFNWVT